MIDWVDYAKCSLGTLNGEWYFIAQGTASTYAAQMEGDYSTVWHAMSSTHGASMVDYIDRESAKKACEDHP